MPCCDTGTRSHRPHLRGAGSWCETGGRCIQLRFLLALGALIWVGTQMAWGSFLQSEEPRARPEPAYLAGENGHPYRRGFVAPRASSICCVIWAWCAAESTMSIEHLVRRRIRCHSPCGCAERGVAVMFAYGLFGLPGLTLVISRVFTLMGNYVLVSVPLFLFMACIWSEQVSRTSTSSRRPCLVRRRSGAAWRFFVRAHGHHGRRDRSRDRDDGRDRAAGDGEPGI